MTTLIMLLPPSRAKNFLLRLLGHHVASTASVGPVLVSGVQVIRIGSRARIGFGNVIRDLDLLEMDADSSIGQWNWISAAPPLRSLGAPLALRLESGAVITSRHYLDVSGGVSIGHGSILAGVRSTIVTHGIDVATDRQSWQPVQILEGCVIGSNCALVAGSKVGPMAQVGMGTVLAASTAKPGSTIVGARPRILPLNGGAYFDRCAVTKANGTSERL